MVRLFLRNLPCDNKIVAVTHSPDCLDNLTFIIRNDLDSFEVLQLLEHHTKLGTHTYNSEVKAPFGKVGRVGLSCQY
jgi:hypothetical protein